MKFKDIKENKEGKENKNIIIDFKGTREGVYGANSHITMFSTGKSYYIELSDINMKLLKKETYKISKKQADMISKIINEKYKLYPNYPYSGTDFTVMYLKNEGVIK